MRATAGVCVGGSLSGLDAADCLGGAGPHAGYRGPMRRALIALVFALPLAACGNNPQTPTGAAATATGGGGGTAACPPAQGADTRTTTFDAPPAMCIDPAKEYTATVTTDAGEFTIDLFAAKAPKSVNNFVVLARHRYYDGVTFHRVIRGFMAQGGDPEGTGRGGPGYEFEDELPSAGEYEIGSVAMANSGPDTNGSQFFIVTGDAGVQLPPQYSLFGKVSQGMETVSRIEADGSADDAPPAKAHTIKTVTVSQK